MTKITDYEPHVTKPVLKGGLISVGREHTGKVAEIYFRKNKNRSENNHERTDTEEHNEGKRETVQDEKGDIRG